MTGERILLVEDELAVSEVIQRMLEQWDYTVPAIARSGRDAIEQTAFTRPDLVLMDIRLPGDMDGTVAAQYIHAHFDTPVIYLTSYSDKETLCRAKLAEPYGYLIKPFEEAELRSTIVMALFKHEMEKKLREREMRYRIITELVADYTYSICVEPDGELVCEWVTDSVERVLGLTPDEINERGSVFSIIHPDVSSFAGNTLKSLLSGKWDMREAQLVDRNGEVRWLLMYNYPIWDETQRRVTRILGAAQDITRRKLAEEEILTLNRELEQWVMERTAALQGSEARYRAIVEDQMEIVCRSLPDRTLTFVNEAFCRYFGGKSDDWLGRTFLPLIYGDDRDKVMDIFDSLTRDESVKTLEHRFVRNDGKPRWLRCIVRALFDEQDLVEFQSVAHDITEMVQAQLQLLHSEKMAAMGRLAASLAHEINNPLQALRSGLRLLSCESLTEEKGRAYLQAARDEVERISVLMERMRDFYRPSLEQWSFVNINEIFHDMWLLLRKQLQTGGVAVRLELAEDLPAVEVVTDQLKQVFLNIILNAVDAMPDGGSLSVKTGWDRARRQVWASFADSGHGISTEAMQRVFEPFYTTEPGGAGLGLPVSFGIVQRFGGHIEVTSQVGKGSEFIVYLPMAELD